MKHMDVRNERPGGSLTASPAPSHDNHAMLSLAPVDSRRQAQGNAPFDSAQGAQKSAKAQ
ncbi:MAG: hypothetical protein IV090_08730 [Candidatus Sericytochromatia bacterium]|nr:hypothetical protein [Candidatus Sericytochromatia bacterium]